MAQLASYTQGGKCSLESDYHALHIILISEYSDIGETFSFLLSCVPFGCIPEYFCIPSMILNFAVMKFFIHSCMGESNGFGSERVFGSFCVIVTSKNS